MDFSPRTSLFGRHEFIVRRVHSLLGLIPVGGYMIIHLATNASILDGGATFQSRVDQLNSLGPSTLLFVEWVFIFLPILFHALVGLAIVIRGERNVTRYPLLGNIRYTLQRWTGVIAFAFIMYHVYHMHGWLRWGWWHQNVAEAYGGAKFDPLRAPATAAAALQASPLILAIYTVGVVSCVYHLANGLWTMGITWGLWTTPRAQRWANYPCAAVGMALLIVSLGALFGFETFPLDAAAGAKPGTRSTVAAPVGAAIQGERESALIGFHK